MPCTYVRVEGDGRAWQGAALVKGIIFLPVTANDYVDVYDGLDTDSGELVCRIISAAVITWNFSFTCGVRFNHGIYLDGIDGEVQTTILFEPLEL